MNLALATVKATTDWRYKILSNIFFFSLILFIISLFKKSWSVARLPLIGTFLFSGIVIYFLLKHLGKE